MTEITDRIDALLANTPASEVEEFEVCRCLRDAKAEITNLREALRRLAEHDATLSVQRGRVTVTMDATLTDEERAALLWFAHYGLPEHRAATLRGLLERLK
jgi:hypothetical protein